MKYGLAEKIIEEIQGVFLSFPQVEKAVLFGSRAKGNYKQGSDIDLTLHGKELKLKTRYKIEDKLDDLLHPYTIDLSIFDQISNPEFVEHIQRVGIVFYARNDFDDASRDVMAKVEGWQAEKLGDVCEILNGGTPKTKVSEYWNGNVLWITPKDMGKLDGIYVDDTSRKITQLGLEKSSAKIIPANSVILSTRAPIGHLAINTKEISTNQGCRGVIPNEKLSTLYLYYFLKSSVDLLNKLGTGTTFKELSKTRLSEVQIPVPPLPEQKRIVALLDEAFDALDQVRANAARNLVNAREVFDSLLNDIVSNPKDTWQEMKLDDTCIVERGSSPRPIKKYRTESADGVNWIKIGDTKNVDRYIFETKEKITKEGAKKSRFVKEGDLILSNSMSFGLPYIMKTKGYIHDGWFVLRLKDFIDTEFFWYLLASPFVKYQFNRLASGAIVKNISSDLVKKANLFVPPLDEQKSLAAKFDEIAEETKALEAVYERKVAAVDELKKSLLQRAFAGEL